MASRRALRSTIVGIASAAVLALAAGGCSSSGNGGASSAAGSSSSSPYVFMMATALSGPYSSYGKAILDGVRVAAEEINADGGILGHKVTIITDDTQADPTTAASEVQQAISSGTKIDALWPGFSSGETDALLPITTPAKILTISAIGDADLNDPAKYPYEFNDALTTEQGVPPFIAMAKAKGFKKVAMIYADDELGITSYDAYAAGLKAAGISVVGAAYDTTALSMVPELEALKATNPDALIIDAFSQQTSYILAGRSQLGWTSIPAFTDSDSGGSLKGLVPASDLANFYEEQPQPMMSNAAVDPALQKLITTAKALGYGPVMTSVGVQLLVNGFNGLEVVAQGAEQADSIDPVDVAKAMEHLKQPSGASSPYPLYYGQYGGFDYTPQNHFPTVNNAFWVFVPSIVITADGLYAAGGPTYFPVG